MSLGVSAAVAFAPLLTMLGFIALSAAPLVAILIAFQATRRAASFSISRPAREILFTVVTREQKYKSKNFIDTVVYRGGDAASGWVFAGFRSLGLGISSVAIVTVPIAAIWLGVALLLGKKQEQRAMAWQSKNGL